MAVRALTIPVPARTWTLLTEPTGGATAVSMQLRGGAGRKAYLQGGATNTLPSNHPVDVPAAEWEFEAGNGELARSMAQLFPDIATPIHLFVWCESATLVTIRHA